MTVLSKEGRSLCYKLLKWTEVYECSPRQTDGYKRPSNNNCMDTIPSMNTIAIYSYSLINHLALTAFLDVISSPSWSPQTYNFSFLGLLGQNCSQR